MSTRGSFLNFKLLLFVNFFCLCCFVVNSCFHALFYVACYILFYIEGNVEFKCGGIKDLHVYWVIYWKFIKIEKCLKFKKKISFCFLSLLFCFWVLEALNCLWWLIISKIMDKITRLRWFLTDIRWLIEMNRNHVKCSGYDLNLWYRNEHAKTSCNSYEP